MQITLHFAGRIALPLSHKYYIQSMLYAMLCVDPAYADFLHNEGFPSAQKPFKLYTFSDLHGVYRIADKQIFFENGFSLTVHAWDTRYVKTMVQFAAHHRDLTLCGQPITLIKYTVQDKHITTEDITVKTRSPITVYTTQNGKTVYFSPDTPAFFEALTDNAYRKWQSVHTDLCPPLRIDPLGTYKKAVTVYKDTYVTAFHGAYRLQGAAPVLDFLYQTGLGSKNAQGFGLFEMIKT